MRKSKMEQQNVLQQVGERFAIRVEILDENSTAYFEIMDKVSKLLLRIDIYLMTCLCTRKIIVTHLRHRDCSENLLVIDESTKVQGPEGDLYRTYLREGKELILASLCSVSDKPGFDLLLAKLTALMKNIFQKLSKDLPEVFTPLREIDLIRLLRDLWDYYKGPGRKINIFLACLKNSPQAAFQTEPPLRKWVCIEISDATPGTFKLVAPNFEKPSKWKARQINDGDRHPVDLVIVDLDFLKSILSAEENMHNGLLIGDRLETKFRTVYDPLMSSTTYEVVKVLKLARAPKMEQQEVFDFN